MSSMTLAQQIITIGMCILGTMVTRYLPFLIFKENKKTPEYIQYLGKFLPSAVFGMLVIYCLKNVEVLHGTHGIPDVLPCRIHEADAPAPVHHDGVVPAGRGQQVPELLRRVPFPAHIVGEPSALGADGCPWGAVAHIRSAGDRADLFPADDEVDTLHVIRVPVGHGFHAEVRRVAPADGPRPVVRGLAGLSVCFQVAGGLLVPQEDGAVADGVPARLRQYFPQVGRGGAETLPSARRSCWNGWAAARWTPLSGTHWPFWC